MSTKKTIQINPELFKMSGSKTKKNKGKKEIALNPVISPNNLKNKLLKRIKEHKTNELKNNIKDNKKNNTANNNNDNNKDDTYTDEFYGAIDYLSELTKKQKQQKAINNKTLKNHVSPNPVASSLTNQIMLDLPPELEEPVAKTNEVFNVNYKPIDDVPYGCLKNGNKKTYREWKELTNPTPSFELPSMIRPPTPPKQNIIVEPQQPVLTREQRLEQIKNKLKKIQEQEYATKVESLPELDGKTESTIPSLKELLKTHEEKIEQETPKKLSKKTIKRKFTLGKSDKLRQVAILLKDKQTRKNIINAQKELKKTNITDVKKYLRQHGIIKVGSTCPADILRKTFESAVMAGEVTNTNKETLLHNLLNETEPK
jgi:hypothetical protein